jgi:hypothetical protein
MNRTLTTFAAAAFAATAFIAPQAQACISCEYVPPVVNTPVHSWGGGGGSYHAKSYSSGHTYTETRRRKRHIEKEVVEKKKRAPRKVETAKAPVKVEKPVETAKAEPVETKPEIKVESENSSLSTASLKKTEEKTAEASDTDTKPANASKVSTNVGCKKFFPTVGMTLSVPCE